MKVKVSSNYVLDQRAPCMYITPGRAHLLGFVAIAPGVAMWCKFSPEQAYLRLFKTYFYLLNDL